MKKIIYFAILCCATLTSAQAKKKEPKPQIIEASCGQCQFGMEGYGCELAVRIEGKSYFVDGTSIDSHGDAHASDGFCSAILKVEVVGKVINNRFKANSLKIVQKK